MRDSSLSACTQAIIAAEVGHLDLAYDYFAEAALMDLDDLEHNTRDGIHIASVAGTWIAAVAGFGGMRDHGGRLTFAPRLPGTLSRLRFRIMFRGHRLQVEVDQEHARYSLRGGDDALDIEHHGQAVTVERSETLELAIPRVKPQEAPRQPPGREPARRRPAGGDDQPRSGRSRRRAPRRRPPLRSLAQIPTGARSAAARFAPPAPVVTRLW